LVGEGVCAALSVPVELDGWGDRHPGRLCACAAGLGS
jgi:hypothetical protein